MSESDTDLPLWELERVWTHRESDRTKHHIRASDKRAAESRLKLLERRGETDDLDNDIASQGYEPLHTHVYRSMGTDTDRPHTSMEGSK